MDEDDGQVFEEEEEAAHHDDDDEEDEDTEDEDNDDRTGTAAEDLSTYYDDDSRVPPPLSAPAAAAAAAASKSITIATHAAPTHLRKRKAPKNFRATFAKFILADPALAAIATETGLMENGELITGGGSNHTTTSTTTTTDEGKWKNMKHLAETVLSVMQEKQKMTSSECADEVVARLLLTQTTTEGDDHKAQARDCRRRVFDVMNVLLSLGVVTRPAKSREVTWVGISMGSSPTDVEMRAFERQALLTRIEAKEERIRQLLIHQLALHGLQEKQAKIDTQEEDRVPLPFVAFSTTANGRVECEVNEDRTQVCLTFSRPMEMKDDNEILRLMRMHELPSRTVKSVVPEELWQYLPESLRPEAGGGEGGG